MTETDIIALIFVSIFALFAYTRGIMREGITFILWLPMIASLIAFMYNSYDPSSFYGYEGVDRDTRGQMRTVSLIFLSSMVVLSIIDKAFFKNMFQRSSESVKFFNGIGGSLLAVTRLYIFAVLATTGYMIYNGTQDVLVEKSVVLDTLVRPQAETFYKDLLDRGYIAESEVFDETDYNNPINKLHKSIQEGQESLADEIPMMGEINRSIQMEQYNKAMRNKVLNGQ